MEEKYIGGIKSTQFKKMHQFYIGGYAIYITSKRLFGVKGSALELMKETATGAVLEALFLPYMSSVTLGKKETMKAIEELENRKDVEIRREDVTEILMKKPSALGFTDGYVKVRVKRGKPLEVSIPHKKDFENVKELMEKFQPSLVKVK
jgi:pantoate kinase